MNPWVAAVVLSLLLLGPALAPAAIVRRRGVVLAGIAAASIAAAAVLVGPSPPTLRLRIDPSTDPLLPLGDPARASHARAVTDFGDDEVYVVAVVCDAVFTTPCLAALERAGDQLARMEAVRSVSHLMDATRYAWNAELDRVDIEPFIETLPDDTLELERLERLALEDPVYRRILLSDDARTAALNVRFREMDDGAFIEGRFDAAIVAVLEEELGATRGFHVAGRPHVKVAVYEGIVSDLLRLGPLVALAMAGVLFLSFGGARASFGGARAAALPLGVAALAVLWTHAALVAAGHALDLITALLAPMLLAVASVYGVHVIARYQEEHAREPDPAAAARAALAEVRLPSLIACVTTVIGFAALMISDVPAVRRFGGFAALGILAATLLSLTAIPALLSLGGVRGSVTGDATPRLDAALLGLAGRVRRRAGTVLGVSTAVLLVSVALIPGIEIDTDQLSNFSREHPVRVDFEAVNERLAGAVPLYVTVDGGAPGALREPALLESIAALQSALDDVTGVGRTISVLDSMGPLNRAFAGDDPAAERIPETRAGASELLFMMPREETSRLLTLDHGRANVVVRTGLVGSSALLELAGRLDDAIAAHPLARDARAELTGKALILARGADGLARSQPLGVLLATLAIAGLVSISLGSLRLGLATMVPNVVPLIAFYGLMGAGAASLSLPTSLVGSMALGIAIDDSVHFMVRYGRERRAGEGPEAAARAATRHVGRPIAITSLMLVLGFGIVMASRFATLTEFGGLAAFTMASCLLADLVLLPALLIRLRV